MTKLRTGKSKANVKVPVSLTDFGMKMAARFGAPGVDDLDMNEIIAAMNNSGEEKLIDVEIFIE